MSDAFLQFVISVHVHDALFIDFLSRQIEVDSAWEITEIRSRRVDQRRDEENDVAERIDANLMSMELSLRSSSNLFEANCRTSSDFLSGSDWLISVQRQSL